MHHSKNVRQFKSAERNKIPMRIWEYIHGYKRESNVFFLLACAGGKYIEVVTAYPISLYSVSFRFVSCFFFVCLIRIPICCDFIHMIRMKIHYF